MDRRCLKLLYPWFSVTISWYSSFSSNNNKVPAALLIFSVPVSSWSAVLPKTIVLCALVWRNHLRSSITFSLFSAIYAQTPESGKKLRPLRYNSNVPLSSWLWLESPNFKETLLLWISTVDCGFQPLRST